MNFLSIEYGVIHITGIFMEKKQPSIRMCEMLQTAA